MSSPRRVGHLKPVSPGPDGEAAAVAPRLDTIEGPDAMARFSRLLDENFGLVAPARFLDDFPIWDERLGPGKERTLRIGVWEGQELVSCAGVRLAKLRVPAGTLEVALIGAVATAASHRARGFASRTVTLATDWARDRGAALAVLWGSEVELYARLGYAPCGQQLRAPLGELALGPAIRDFSQITLGRGWVDSLAGCLRMRGSGLKLEREDERWLAEHRGTDWYWLGDPVAPLAYAAIGRGIDLPGIVHEWGGDDPESLRTLLQLVRLEHPEAQLLANPGLLQAWGLLSAGADAASALNALSCAPETLCLANPLDEKKIAAAFGGKASELIFAELPLWFWGLDAV